MAASTGSRSCWASELRETKSHAAQSAPSGRSARGDTRRPQRCGRKTVPGRRSAKPLQGRASLLPPLVCADQRFRRSPRAVRRAGATGWALWSRREPRRRDGLPLAACSGSALGLNSLGCRSRSQRRSRQSRPGAGAASRACTGRYRFLRDSLASHRMNMPIAAANMSAAVVPMMARLKREIGWPSMIFRSEATMRIPTSRKGARRPLITALQ